MSIAATIATLRLLHAVNARPHGRRPEVDESELPLSGDNRPASLFEPRRRPKRTLVLVHGVTGRANRDPLIVHLGRSLAALGYRAVVPELTKLSQFQHDPKDIQTVVEAIASCQGLDDRGVGILAFSYGASYALRAAADPKVARTCKALVGFGAYYELLEALEHQRQLLLRNPELERDDADVAYLRYTLLASSREALGLSAEAWLAIDAVLVDFTSPRPLEASLAPLLRYARHVDYVALMQAYQRREFSPALSPAGVLSRLHCSVGLLHDPNDRFVPPNHVTRIADELDRRPNCPRTEILTTPMLSHVRVDPMRGLLDLPKLVRLLDRVLG
jgi:pimeloyl-ACP methyl ester carboxylesterase